MVAGPVVFQIRAIWVKVAERGFQAQIKASRLMPKSTKRHPPVSAVQCGDHKQPCLDVGRCIYRAVSLHVGGHRVHGVLAEQAYGDGPVSSGGYFFHPCCMPLCL